MFYLLFGYLNLKHFLIIFWYLYNYNIIVMLYLISEHHLIKIIVYNSIYFNYRFSHKR